MQGKEFHNGCSVRFENQSLGIIVRHLLVSLEILNSHTLDGIFNPHLTNIKDFYIFDRKRSYVHVNVTKISHGVVKIIVCEEMNTLLNY